KFPQSPIMIQRIKQKWQRTWHTTTEKSAIELAEQIQLIRSHSDILAITGKAYGNQWRGVNNSAVEMFPNAVFSVQHQSSQNMYSPKELSVICDSILQA